MVRFFTLLLSFATIVFAQVQLIKKETHDSNTTLLVIGGIHGNEPGGYFSASILATHYTILSKNLWIVPNLNAQSIVKNRRGIHGDMNRKFSVMKKNDKDKEIVQEIKKIILDPQVSLVLNLHDGHGFYRKNYQGSIFNPNAWGQTCVIDQCQLKTTQTFGDLDTIAKTVRDKVNKKLLQKHHSFNVKNTKTKYEDEQMRLSLTYFAVTHNKPAFAIETSKNLSALSQKVFYQLLAIEEYMHIMGIKFQRDFKLSQKNLQTILQDYGTLAINGNILLKLSNIKKHLSFIPIKSKNNRFEFSHPLGKVVKNGNFYNVFIGNKKITQLKAQYFELSSQCPSLYDVYVDGTKHVVHEASYFDVNDDFKLDIDSKYRVNVIGFHKAGIKNENNISISFSQMDQRYSADKDHKDFRIEVYNEDKFCSMLMVHFK